MAIKNVQDFSVKVHWNLMDITKPPMCSGIYAITDPTKKTWFYIGKANNIAKRIACKNHPIQVTKSIKLKLCYLFLRAKKEDIGWLERFLIKEYSSEWNGGTSFEPSPMGHTPWMFCNIYVSCTECTQKDLLLAVNSMP